MQLNFATRTLFCGIYDAPIERPRINVHAYRTLVEFAGIVNPMHRLIWINGAGLCRIHLHDFRGPDVAFAGGHVLLNHVIILHQQTAQRDRHPAILVAMIVN